MRTAKNQTNVKIFKSFQHYKIATSKNKKKQRLVTSQCVILVMKNITSKSMNNFRLFVGLSFILPEEVTARS